MINVGDRSPAVKATIDQLRTQQNDIAGAMAELHVLFDKSYAEAAPHLGPVRTRVARAIARHLNTEDEALLTPLRERRLMGELPGCEAIVAETRDLRLAYSTHIRVWTAGAVAERWDDYIDATRQLNARMAVLCQQKMRSFYPAVLRRLFRDSGG